MSTRVVDQVDSWDDRSFSGGYRELHDLADSEFSGVVRAGGAELYMTRGVGVGIRQGDIEDFQGSGTVYQAPADALPLLAIMQERSDEVRAKYYTEKTSISKVDNTLSDGGFTGFIELSENVLSGDYYLVYQAGKSMSVGYVGESGRLIDGDEAFETANDEVGIYKVRPVDIEPLEIPEPENTAASEPGANDSGSGTESAATPANEQQAQTESQDETEPPGSDTESTEAGNGAEPTPESDEQKSQSGSTAASTQPEGTVDRTDEESATEGATANDDESGRTEARATQPGTADRQSAGTESRSSESRRETDAKSEPEKDSQSETRSGTTQTGKAGTQAQQPHTENQRDRSGRAGTNPAGHRQGAAEPSGKQGKQSGGPQSPREPARSDPASREPARGQRSGRQSEATGSQDLETKAVPSLDPNKTAVPDDTGTSSSIPSPSPQSQSQSGSRDSTGRAPGPGTGPAQSEKGREAQVEPRPQEPQTDQTAPRPDQPQPTGHQSQSPPAAPQSSADEGAPKPQQAADEPETESIDTEELEELEAKLETKEEEIERLEDELDTTTHERDELEAEVEELEREREELSARVKELEGELNRLEEELGAATDAERRLTSDQALAGTDIFVRYRSKGKATLEKAHGGSTRKDEVNENLRLEKHTQFDSTTVSVGGQSYSEFLESTLEYQFVRWIVRELLFEIRETGHEKALIDLYNVLPRIDRAELAGVIDVTYTEDGQETQSQEAFDVVLRDRMGNPLLAANLNDTREATTEGMMERLITSAERVGQSSEGFSGAFLVTESFFDPGALEVASAATQGGLLSRDKRKSFVNLSRKTGYHLCLVEARNENFHLAVPEL